MARPTSQSSRVDGCRPTQQALTSVIDTLFHSRRSMLSTPCRSCCLLCREVSLPLLVREHSPSPKPRCHGHVAAVVTMTVSSSHDDVSSNQQQPHASAALLAHTLKPSVERSRSSSALCFSPPHPPSSLFLRPAPLITLTPPLPSRHARIFPLSSARLRILPRLREAVCMCTVPRHAI